jgi:sulfite exporter TauE/SafE
MNLALILAGLALGVATTPHCAAMCGAPCAALGGGSRRRASGFHLGRLAGYMAGGAVAAGSVALLGSWSQAAPALRPLWMLLHLAFLALGLWWLATARPLPWMSRGEGGEGMPPFAPITLSWRASGPGAAQRRGRRPVLRSTLAGLAWVAWPCAALQGALLLSALAASPLGGALVMAGFALGSMPALLAAPWLWARWQAVRGRRLSPGDTAALGFRVAGTGLILASGWALTHGLWARVAAWCVS